MISGVAVVDDAGYPTGIPEIKSSSETNADPQSSRQGNGASKLDADRDGTAQTAASPFDGFGDLFSPESAQALLDAQETLPAPQPRVHATADTGNGNVASTDSDETAEADANPLDTNQDGMVSFVEWLQSQGSGTDLTARTGDAAAVALIAAADGSIG